MEKRPKNYTSFRNIRINNAIFIIKHKFLTKILTRIPARISHIFTIVIEQVAFAEHKNLYCPLQPLD